MDLKQELVRKTPYEYLRETRSSKLSRGFHDYSNLYNMSIGSLIAYHGAPLRVMEIGVSLFGVGSGHAFSEMPYLEKYVGIDVDPVSSPLGEKGVFILGDAYSEEIFEKVKSEGPFHLLIDDGPHDYHFQETFFRMYRELATVPWMMICEDVMREHVDLLCAAIKRLDWKLSPVMITLHGKNAYGFNNAILVSKFS